MTWGCYRAACEIIGRGFGLKGENPETAPQWQWTESRQKVGAALSREAKETE